LTHRPNELSGGQQQRVAIARDLVTRPDVVFANEPTGNLVSRSGAEVLSFLRTNVRELGQTVVMGTHDPVAASYADSAVRLAEGRSPEPSSPAPTSTSALRAPATSTPVPGRVCSPSAAPASTIWARPWPW